MKQSSGTAILADLDGDGNDDLVSSMTTGIGWKRAVPETSSFAPRQPLIRAGRLLAVEDLDNDGDADVVGIDAELFWLENNRETGRFVEHRIGIEVGSPQARLTHFLAGDVDGDALIDFVVETETAGTSRFAFLKGVAEGDQLEWQITQERATSASRRMVLADLDHDQDLDLLTNPGGLRWAEFNGLGFEMPQQHPSIPNARLLAVADLDRDGLQDVILAEEYGFIRYEATGSGTEFVSIEGALGGYHPSESPTVFRVRIADWNGDGRDDVWAEVGLSPGGEAVEISVAIQNSDGRISTRSSSITQRQGATYSDWLTPDINADGSAELLYLNRRGDLLVVTPEVATVAVGIDPAIAIESRDFDQDGDQDLLSLSADHCGADPIFMSPCAILTLYENQDGRGGFAEGIRLALVNDENVFDASLLVGDFDLDGDEDILVEAGDSYWVIENIGGQNRFRSAVRRSFSSEGLPLKPGTLRATDWDLDGDLDLVAVEFANRRFVRFENRDRDLTFTEMTIVVGAIPGFQQVEIGDLNGDGRPDVIAEWANEAGWFANGVEQSWTRGEFGNDIAKLLLFDVDSDGDTDVVVVRESQSLNWYENDSAGNFRRHASVDLQDAQFRDWLAADLDGDGDTDIVATQVDGVVWFENLGGQQGFANVTKLITSNGAGLITTTDVDGDNHIDLISSLSREQDGLRWSERRMAGDVNQDGVFDSQDLVQIAAAGLYDIPNANPSYDQGDFNGDGEFNSRDLVFALQAGYTQ